jgi:hypothetical protein
MGRWGEGLFEGDTDLDVASYISEDAGIELYYYELDESKEEDSIGGKGLEATRAHLNNGVLNRLFTEYAKKNDCHGMVSKKLGLVFLGKSMFDLDRSEQYPSGTLNVPALLE